MKYIQETKPMGKVRLDLKDKKILWLLSQNCRLHHTEIAKKVALSRDAVSYRINNLTKAGIIQGYRTIIDVNEFGFYAYHLFLQLNQPKEEAELKLIEKFKKNPFVRAILKFSGKYDLELALIAKNVKDLDSLLTKIISQCGKYLQDYEVLAISDTFMAETLPKSFLKQEGKRKQKTAYAKIDKKDKEILRILSENANLQLYKIASKVNISPDAVNYRIKKMINSGVIIKFVPVINYSALLYNIYGVLLRIHSFTEEKEEKLRRMLKNDNNVIWAVKMVGKYNVLIYVCTENIEELHTTLIRLRSSFPEDVKDYETLIAYEEYKYTYFPDCI